MNPAQSPQALPVQERKAHFLDLIYYFRSYRNIALFSILGLSFFEILDLFVPYAIGQLLNLLSKQPIDGALQTVIETIAQSLHHPITPSPPPFRSPS